MPKGMIYIYMYIYMTNKTHDIWGCLNQWDIRAVVAIKHPLKMVVHPIKLRTKSPRVGEDHSKIEGKCRRCRQTIDPVLSISPLPKNIQQIFNNKSTINPFIISNHFNLHGPTWSRLTIASFVPRKTWTPTKFCEFSEGKDGETFRQGHYFFKLLLLCNALRSWELLSPFAPWMRNCIFLRQDPTRSSPKTALPSWMYAAWWKISRWR